MAPEDDASEVYGNQVSQIVDGAARGSTFTPANPEELFIKNRRAPKSVAELSPIEKTQLERMWPGQDLDRLLQFGDEQEDMPLDIELADVVDEHGTHRYTIWGANFGVMFLFVANTLQCAAFASQHSVERWGTDLRDLFWAMDRALQRKDHGFRQPLAFEWYADEKWAAIEGKPRGTLYSEAAVHAQLAGTAAKT